MPVRKLLYGLCLVLLAADIGRAAEPTAEPPRAALRSLTLLPNHIDLDGPRAEQHLVVLGEYADGRRWDLTREARFSSGRLKVATIDSTGLVHAVGDGTATITVRAGGQEASVVAKVKNVAAEVPISFVREVVPVLTKAGCNQGACHGAAVGRGGFRLSLLGYDPAFDHKQIVESAEGRRVVLSEPERSILLLKPTLTMEHGGGERFAVGSRSYEILRRWLEDGAPEPEAKSARVSKLEVGPATRVMVPSERQQFLVSATWSDGRVEDVTATAQYDPLNEAIATVTPAGLVTAHGHGESYVMVRFGGQATVAQVTLPYAPSPPTPLLPGERGRGEGFRPNNFIDEKLLAHWKALGLTPSPLCTDEEFFRRLHLDVIGTLPAPADIKAFLADRDPAKRAKAIDKVLNRPEFVDYWTLKWGDLLRIDRDALNEKGMWSFTNWVRASLREQKPVDEFVRDIITAEGSTFTEGPANYYRVANNPQDWAETTAQVFLGVRMQCARCHHHPFEKWSQDDYYGMSAFFVRLATKSSREFGIFGGETVVYLRSAGEQTHPKKGGVVKPHPLDGPAMDDPFDRRRKLADWLTAPANPFFAKNIVNRFWGYLMGRGLVEPLDDLRATNPPSNPDLLDALAKDFVAHKYDLKHLLRSILNSRAYQLRSLKTDGNAADAGNVQHTRYTVKRLTAEQIADALDSATGTREKYQGLPLGTRAIQLPDTKVRSFFLDTFGRPPRQITCECERSTQPNIAQALHLLNGDFLNRKINAPTGRIEGLLKAKTRVPDIVESLYLTTVSRPPQAGELARALDWIKKAPNQREGLQDLEWVLLNSTEFLFNH